MTTIINGRKIARQLNRQTARQVTRLRNKGIIPKLVLIMAGDDSANSLYVRIKARMAKRLGIHPVVTYLSNQIDQSQLIQLITQYNQDLTVDGILVQSPLPRRINERLIDDRVKPVKDVDGFSSVNVGHLFLNDRSFYPVACTPRGIMTLLRKYRVELNNQSIVIIGTRRMVGRPLLGLMINAGANVSLLSPDAKDLFNYTRSADVIISAAGQVNLIDGSDVKPGCTIIDASNNHDTNGKLVGDVNFNDAKSVAGKITPVPGGVGPMTIATLMQQTVELCKLHHNLMK